MSDVVTLIKERLAGLEPEFIDITDDSAAHAGHAGARSGGGHFSLTIVSRQFGGLGRIARHRLVHAALDDLFPNRIHALAIKALSPDEI